MHGEALTGMALAAGADTSPHIPGSAAALDNAAGIQPKAP